MLLPPGTLALGKGLTAMIATARARGDTGLVERVRSTSLTLTWLVGLTLAALTALASPWLADALFHDRRWTWVVLVGAAAVPLSAIASLRVSILQGYQAVKAMAGLNRIIGLASMLTIAPLAWFFRLPGAVAQLVVVAAVYVFASGWLEGRQRDVLEQ